MNDILEEFEKYISSNKEVLSVLPVNTKKNRSKYVEQVEEMEGKALTIKDVIWEEIMSRYNRILNVEENPEIAKITKEKEDLGNVELLNELNTPFEKLELDKITHSLSCFFEGDLNLVNQNIKLFLDIFKDYGIELTEKDFEYSEYTYKYMKAFLEENPDEIFNSQNLNKLFENIYWKCPEVVTHLELNMRYLYYINSKKIEAELNVRNAKMLEKAGLDKQGLVKKFFDLDQELIKVKQRDKKVIIDKFVNGEWKIKDFNSKDMEVLYDRLALKDYYNSSEVEQEKMDENFSKLYNTLKEYDIYIRYKYIIDDLKRRNTKDANLKSSYESKNKELRAKEKILLKNNKKNKKNIKLMKNPFLRFFRKKIERKIYEFPVNYNNQIKELKKLYLELDDEIVKLRIDEFVDDNCSIKYMFKIAISFYTYVYNLIKQSYTDEDINVVDELQNLIDFINQPYKVMLNNIKLMEEDDITSIISNRYKILNIKLEKEDLEENFESILNDVEKIVNFYNIRKSGLDIDDIAFMEKVKQMLAKK